MRYAFTAKVKSVEEKFAPERTDGKDAEDAWLFARDSLGWFVVTADGTAYGLGSERPDIAAGDTVKITLEKVI